MKQSIKEILINRDGLSVEEADQLIAEACETLQEYLTNNDSESAYNICEEYFNLEPDYLDELL